ncbi:hypothetical protein [Prosthecomicrobium sp. N25]|uniref:hypothetical protein n=1 Tax=Prosthecomicrobium sp. N25 TaxID=3129254 RepID=UPI00307817F6
MRRHGIGAAGVAAAGFLVFTLGLTPERAGSTDAACDAARFAGAWRNVAPVEGSDVIAADIRVDCREQDAGKPRAEIALRVRCLRYECAWQAIPAAWTGSRADRLGLVAAYREDRVERAITVEAPANGRLRLSVTTRFLRVPLEPRQVTYEMERVEN